MGVRMINRLIVSIIFFHVALHSFATSSDSNNGLKDTLYVIFERQFNQNDIKVFQNGILIGNERVSTRREHGLLSTGYYSTILFDNYEDRIVV